MCTVFCSGVNGPDDPVAQILGNPDRMALGDARLPELVGQAQQLNRERLETEVARLTALQKVNPAIRDEEIAYLVEDDIPSIHMALTLRTGDKVRLHFVHPPPPSPPGPSF